MSFSRDICRLCGSPLQDAALRLLHPVSSEILPLISEKRVQTEFRSCSNCETVNVVNDDSRRFLGYGSPWLRYTEPAQHFPDVLESHSHGPSAEVSRVVGLSEKDESLVDFLSMSGSRSTANRVFSTEHQEWQSVNSGKSKTLWVARRFLEHINDSSMIEELLGDVVNVGHFLYVEMLDFEEMQNHLSGLYLWPERTLYPRLEVVTALLQAYGFKIVDVRRCRQNKNSFWWLIAERRTDSARQDFRRSSHPGSSTDVVSHFTKTISSVTASLDRFCGQKTAALFGVNHKSQTLGYCLQDMGWKISFHDGSPLKIGKYSGVELIAPFSAIPSSTECILMFFNNNTTLELERDIKKRSAHVSIINMAEY